MSKAALTPDQRRHLADKLMDSANIFLASLVVGQFLERDIHWLLVFTGLLLYLFLVVITTAVMKGGDR